MQRLRAHDLGYAMPLLLLAACGGAAGIHHLATATPSATPSASARSDHVCVPKPLPYPPPGPALDFAVDGQHSFSLGAKGVSIPFTMTQRPGVTVTRLQFVVEALHSTSPNITVRTFPVVRETWGPGQHVATVRWDGTDDHGRRLPAGRYRVEARVSGTVPLPVICQDGSGHGVELFTGTSGMGLNVVVRVP